MSKTTIMLADDHHVVRLGLRALLSAQPDFDVVGEAADGLAALALAERLKPDVLIVDLAMAGLDGLEVTRRLHELWPRTRIIVLSMHTDESYVLAALKHGALGYVPKDAGAPELIRAVREVLAGRRYLSPPLSARALERYIQQPFSGPSDAYDRLTDREREVLQLLAQGLTSAEIGGRLSISARTVESHRAHLMRKLGLHNQAELIRFSLKRGLLP